MPTVKILGSLLSWIKCKKEQNLARHLRLHTYVPLSHLRSQEDKSLSDSGKELGTAKQVSRSLLQWKILEITNNQHNSSLSLATKNYLIFLH
jgi:hypothetical protein